MVYGVGINDADYKVQIKQTIQGKRKLIWICPFYRKWQDMLKRCYSEKFIKKHATYAGCTVCEEWKLFSNFKSWMESQNWENMQLDKDLMLYENKHYCPEACVFVSPTVNSFLIKCDKSRGIYPLGVTRREDCHNPYQVQVGIGKSKSKYLGVFATPHVAHRAWQLAKIEYGLRLAKSETHIKVKQGLLRVVSKIQNDYDNNLETVDF